MSNWFYDTFMQSCRMKKRVSYFQHCLPTSSRVESLAFHLTDHAWRLLAWICGAEAHTVGEVASTPGKHFLIPNIVQRHHPGVFL